MTTTKHRVLSLAAVAALGFALASCTGGTDGDETTAPDAGPESGAEQTETAGTDDSEGEAATTDGATATAAATGPECLIGTWEMTADAAEAQILAMFGGEGEVTVEGTQTIVFDGETYSATADSSGTFDVEAEGARVQGSVVSQGTFVMQYTADDAELTFGDVVSAEGSVVTEVAGAEQEIGFAETAELLTGTSQQYTCTDTELTIVSSGAGIEIEQTYTRT